MTAVYRPVTLLGVGYDDTGDIAVMVLREVGGDRALPIWISAHEGGVIESLALRGRSTRPLAHDVLVDVVHALGRTVTEGVVSDVADGIFLAEIRFDGGARVDARPSDMVRVALTAGVPMHVEASVLDQAAVSLDEADPVPDPAGDEQAADVPSAVEIDAKTALFRAWLDTARVEDFGAGP